MNEEISKEHVGKYVCYQQADGGACWGRVKNQGIVNTLKGEREVHVHTFGMPDVQIAIWLRRKSGSHNWTIYLAMLLILVWCRYIPAVF